MLSRYGRYPEDAPADLVFNEDGSFSLESFCEVEGFEYEDVVQVLKEHSMRRGLDGSLEQRFVLQSEEGHTWIYAMPAHRHAAEEGQGAVSSWAQDKWQQQRSHGHQGQAAAENNAAAWPQDKWRRQQWSPKPWDAAGQGQGHDHRGWRQGAQGRKGRGRGRGWHSEVQGWHKAEDWSPAAQGQGASSHHRSQQSWVSHEDTSDDRWRRRWSKDEDEDDQDDDMRGGRHGVKQESDDEDVVIVSVKEAGKLHVDDKIDMPLDALVKMEMMEARRRWGITFHR